MRRAAVLICFVVGINLLVPVAAGAATLSWTRVAPSGANFAQPGLARTADGILHVLFVATNAADSNTRDVLVAPVSNTGQPGAAAPVQEAWNHIDLVPELLVAPDGTLRAFWGGTRSLNQGDPNQFGVNTATAPASGAPWSLFPGVVARGAGEFGGDTAATYGPDGTPFLVSGQAFVHRGLDPNTPNHDYHSDLGGGNGYGANIATDRVTGEIFVVWYSSADPNNGIYAREVDPATGAPLGPAVRMPGSATMFQGKESSRNPIARIPLVARPDGGLYTVYGAGYPSVDSVLLWRIGDATSTTITTAEGLTDAVALTAAPDGRLWALYAQATSGRPKALAEVSSADLTEWTPPLSLSVPASLGDFVVLFKVDADAGADFADVIVNLSDGASSGTSFWHARFPSAPQWTDGPDEITGGAAPDFLFGGGGNDVLSGKGGKDQLNGGAGKDKLDGGPRKDILDGGPGRDICFVTRGDKKKSCEVIRTRRNFG